MSPPLPVFRAAARRWPARPLARSTWCHEQSFVNVVKVLENAARVRYSGCCFCETGYIDSVRDNIAIWYCKVIRFIYIDAPPPRPPNSQQCHKNRYSPCKRVLKRPKGGTKPTWNFSPSGHEEAEARWISPRKRTDADADGGCRLPLTVTSVASESPTPRVLCA